MKVRGLAANSALAFAGDVASKAGALLVILLAARLFSVEEFALVATALACEVLVSLLDLGAGTLLTRDGASGASSRGLLADCRGSRPARRWAARRGAVGRALARGPLTALAVAILAIAARSCCPSSASTDRVAISGPRLSSG